MLKITEATVTLARMAAVLRTAGELDRKKTTV